jgi:hypothetical protein
MRYCPCKNRHNCLLSAEWHIIVQIIERKGSYEHELRRVRADNGMAMINVGLAVTTAKIL